jgi:predicted RNA methylase
VGFWLVLLGLGGVANVSSRKFDTVIMNPPFGTRNGGGADWMFLELGLKRANFTVYSLHKSSTRKYLLEKVAREFENRWSGQVVAELKFDIPKSYSFHKKQSVDVAVDLLKFEFKAT